MTPSLARQVISCTQFSTNLITKFWKCLDAIRDYQRAVRTVPSIVANFMTKWVADTKKCDLLQRKEVDWAFEANATFFLGNVS